MIKPIRMPKYGLQQDEGTVVHWRKAEGDRVKKGDILLELESDKALFEYEAPEPGYLRKILARDGDVVPVLSVIAVLSDDSDEPFDPAALPDAPAPQTTPPPEPAPASEPPPEPDQRIRSSPAARRRARELGVDIATLTGTGPRGRITAEDVERATEQKQAPAAAPERIPISRMRRAIGSTMAHSKSTIPHFYVSAEIDMTSAETWRGRTNAEQGIRLSVTDLLVKAAAVTLADFPALNASLDGDDAILLHPRVHIGLAVGTDDGLVVPVIADASNKPLTALAVERAAAVEAARAGRMRGSERSTFTITNLGTFGVTSFIAIVTPPEAAVLATGAILPQVRPIGEPLTLAVRNVMQITLSADHRLVDGVLAARYLQAFKERLETVETLQNWL